MGRKRENPEKNHLTHPQAELGLSHMYPDFIKLGFKGVYIDLIMSKANLLKGTPFSICYDLPKEINEARKKLWDELKSIKSKRPNARVQIVYPAKLVVEGKVVRDEFPDWGNIIQASRLPDFTYVENSLPVWNVCDSIDTSADNRQQSTTTHYSILPTSTVNDNGNATDGKATLSTR